MGEPSKPYADSRTRTHKTRAINPAETLLYYSPETAQAFRKLEAIVRGSPHVDPATQIYLQWVANEGKPNPLPPALADLLKLGRTVEAYVQATGDERAREALMEIENCLMGMGKKVSRTGAGFTLEKTEPRRDR